MKQRHKSKPEDDTFVYDNHADPVERASAIMRLTVDGFEQIEPLLAELIHHESLFLRGQAIKSLLSVWMKPRYIGEAIRMLHSDPEWLARGNAAFAMSWFAHRTGEQRELVIGELIKALMQDSNSVVQKRCYEGLQQLLAPGKQLSSIPDDFWRDRDVDWELLKPYLNNQTA